ncbi:hypothetical protein DENIS_1388 [Desulfonema ishimotonii]|uniref:Uncharacterized protein n=1 Tax=Desulfonema ishimotonii TaxID=45657 RepID=A0A401FTZ2_9BACT|nr:hypothetical protein [Desulfonema ishimotonii]GBC60436.1 hypothetical protein DENIS_1388 [Desulfonema ishimotonii]
MNDYQKEQLETLRMVRQHLASVSETGREKLRAMISPYLGFRSEVADFSAAHFGETCTRNCYESKLSACCSKDGIITFFADVAVNVLMSGADALDTLEDVLQKPNTGFKCVYLGETGCLWQVKPIVCEMFLCDAAMRRASEADPACEAEWKALETRKKGFAWPDRPVVFDALERFFMDAGYRSPLMYLHNSPGLLRVKQKSMEKGTYTHEG